MLEALSRAAFERDVGRLDARLARQRGWDVVSATYPFLDVVFKKAAAVPLRVRFNCTGWDDVPPSIELLGADGAPLSALPTCGGIINTSPHPTTGRPFVCMRGSREFHTHPSHLGEVWDNYRSQSGNDLLGLMDQISRAWRRYV